MTENVCIYTTCYCLGLTVRVRCFVKCTGLMMAGIGSELCTVWLGWVTRMAWSVNIIDIRQRMLDLVRTAKVLLLEWK